MSGGRPPLGASLVDLVEGPEEAKLRLKTILEVIAREKTVEEACAVLRISRAYYYVLQTEMFNGAIEALRPRPPGRPPAARPVEDPRVHVLEGRVRELEIDIAAALIREEVATTLPHVAARRVKKTARRKSQ